MNELVLARDEARTAIQRIAQFQQVVQEQLQEGRDYGHVPGSDKPVLLKPGAEKLILLLGLRLELEIIDSTRDWETGFFQYMVKARLIRDTETGPVVVSEGLGTANTREKRYRNQDPYMVDNTALKIAEKRAVVDASLHVGALSNLFTQDLEDYEEPPAREQAAPKPQAKPAGAERGINDAQRKRLWALAMEASGGDRDRARALARKVMRQFGYDEKDEIKVSDYDAICALVQADGGDEDDVEF